MDPIVHTRPERTQAEIRTDRNNASAFYRGLRRIQPWNLPAFIERESQDHRLYMATAEARNWTARHYPTRTQRKARAEERLAAHPRLVRDDSQLRPYVHPRVAAAMPAPALHTLSRTEIELSEKESASWRFRSRNWKPGWRAFKIRQASTPFEHWLLRHPTYGITNENAPIIVTRDEARRFHYRKGEIRPAGLTPERALHIALNALEYRGGKW